MVKFQARRFREVKIWAPGADRAKDEPQEIAQRLEHQGQLRDTCEAAKKDLANFPRKKAHIVYHERVVAD